MNVEGEKRSVLFVESGSTRRGDSVIGDESFSETNQGDSWVSHEHRMGDSILFPV